MKTISITAAILGLAVMASPALSQEEDARATNEAADAAENFEDVEPLEPLEEEEDDRMQEVLCRTENITGSLTRRTRTCLTRAEWQSIERRTRENVDDMQGRASGANSCRFEGPGAVCY